MLSAELCDEQFYCPEFCQLPNNQACPAANVLRPMQWLLCACFTHANSSRRSIALRGCFNTVVAGYAAAILAIYCLDHVF
jgi:hypothetical protein